MADTRSNTHDCVDNYTGCGSNSGTGCHSSSPPPLSSSSCIDTSSLDAARRAVWAGIRFGTYDARSAHLRVRRAFAPHAAILCEPTGIEVRAAPSTTNTTTATSTTDSQMISTDPLHALGVFFADAASCIPYEENRTLALTSTTDGLIEERCVRIHHTRSIPWLLPAMPPTGRTIVAALTFVVVFRPMSARIISLRVKWDQLAVLRQAGCLPESHFCITNSTEIPLPTTEQVVNATTVLSRHIIDFSPTPRTTVSHNTVDTAADETAISEALAMQAAQNDSELPSITDISTANTIIRDNRSLRACQLYAKINGSSFSLAQDSSTAERIVRAPPPQSNNIDYYNNDSSIMKPPVGKKLYSDVVSQRSPSMLHTGNSITSNVNASTTTTDCNNSRLVESTVATVVHKHRCSCGKDLVETVSVDVPACLDASGNVSLLLDDENNNPCVEICSTEKQPQSRQPTIIRIDRNAEEVGGMPLSDRVFRDRNCTQGQGEQGSPTRVRSGKRMFPGRASMESGSQHQSTAVDDVTQIENVIPEHGTTKEDLEIRKRPRTLRERDWSTSFAP